MLDREISGVFNEISRLASVELAPKCTTDEADKELQAGLSAFDRLRKLLSEIAESDNQAIAKNPP